MAEAVGISRVLYQVILTKDLEMRHVSVKLFPQLVSQEQKANYLSVTFVFS
jgi:hypothetical protein